MAKRNRNIEEAFFPVSKHPLYFDNTNGMSKEFDNEYTKIVNNKEYNFVNCPRHNAIVRDDKLYVYQCVSADYELITNKEAVEQAFVIARLVFGKSSLMDVENKSCILAHNHDGQCSMYFWDEDIFFNGEEDDKWIPYVSISNSYNRTIKLQYNFGFKLIDANEDIEIVFDELNISLKKDDDFTFENLPLVLEKVIVEKNLHNKVEIKKRFTNIVQKLKRLYLDDDEFFPLVLKFFDAKFGKDAKDDTLQKYRDLFQYISRIRRCMYKKPNLYYFMKVLACYISTPSSRMLSSLASFENEGSSALSFSLKYRIKLGQLMSDMIDKMNNTSIDIKQYVGQDFFDRAKLIVDFNITPFNY